MQNTRNFDLLGGALLDVLSILNSPKRDDVLLAEAGVDIDRALFPLLVALDVRGPLVVSELADLVGRDHTTVSRQLAKLESLKLVKRRDGAADRRKTTTTLTAGGAEIAHKIARARWRLLAKALADWSDADRGALATLNRRFADTLLARSKGA
ncbi:MAG: MarR family transcriptional regulator [Rhizomicrobium sp.]